MAIVHGRSSSREEQRALREESGEQRTRCRTLRCALQFRPFEEALRRDEVSERCCARLDLDFETSDVEATGSVRTRQERETGFLRSAHACTAGETPKYVLRRTCGRVHHVSWSEACGERREPPIDDLVGWSSAAHHRTHAVEKGEWDLSGISLRLEGGIRQQLGRIRRLVAGERGAQLAGARSAKADRVREAIV